METLNLITIPGIPDEFSSMLLKAINLTSYPEIEQVLVFGSRAKGNFRPGSDIDLAIKGPVTIDQVWEIQAAINQLELPWKTDVVALNNKLDEGFRKEIERFGLVVWER